MISAHLFKYTTYTLYGGCVTILIEEGHFVADMQNFDLFCHIPPLYKCSQMRDMETLHWRVPFSCGRLIRQIWDHFPRLVLDLHT